MAKDPPENKVTYEGLDAAKLKEHANVLKEALVKSGVDVNEALGIKTESKQEEQKNQPVADNKAIVEKWTPIFETAKKTLQEAGVKFDTPAVDPVDAKFGELKKQVDEQLEKFSEAKFGEQVKTIKDLYKDFPVEAISKLGTNWSTKVEIANAMTPIAQQVKDTVSKLQKELDEANTKYKEIQNYAPKNEAQKGSGLDRIKEMQSKLGMKVMDTDKKPENTE